MQPTSFLQLPPFPQEEGFTVQATAGILLSFAEMLLRVSPTEDGLHRLAFRRTKSDCLITIEWRPLNINLLEQFGKGILSNSEPHPPTTLFPEKT